MNTFDCQNNHGEVTYTLSEVRFSDTGCCYFITASLQNDVAVACVKGSKESVQEIYRKIVQGTVTPCTLHDVLDDIAVSSLTQTILVKNTVFLPLEETAQTGAIEADKSSRVLPV